MSRIKFIQEALEPITGFGFTKLASSLRQYGLYSHLEKRASVDAEQDIVLSFIKEAMGARAVKETTKRVVRAASKKKPALQVVSNRATADLSGAGRQVSKAAPAAEAATEARTPIVINRRSGKVTAPPRKQPNRATADMSGEGHQLQQQRVVGGKKSRVVSNRAMVDMSGQHTLPTQGAPQVTSTGVSGGASRRALVDPSGANYTRAPQPRSVAESIGFQDLSDPAARAAYQQQAASRLAASQKPAVAAGGAQQPGFWQQHVVPAWNKFTGMFKSDPAPVARRGGRVARRAGRAAPVQAPAQAPAGNFWDNKVVPAANTAGNWIQAHPFASAGIAGTGILGAGMLGRMSAPSQPTIIKTSEDSLFEAGIGFIDSIDRTAIASCYRDYDAPLLKLAAAFEAENVSVMCESLREIVAIADSK